MVMLTPTTHDEIKFACRTYHYAHCIPSVSYGYNVFNERYEWCGVILFGTGATPNIGKPFGMEQSEVVELVRVALNGLQPCTSECVAAALKQLHEDAPQIKIVVSYADADQNHYGTIYQATNWIYLGMKEQNALGAFIIHGKKVHRRTIGSAGGEAKHRMGAEKPRPERTGISVKRETEIHLCVQQKTAEEMASTGATVPETKR